MGVFEFPAFANGTNAVAKAMADQKDAVTIVGGGDSASAVEKMRLCRQDHPHLHRRRRFPGVPGGPGPARHRLPG